MSKIIAAVLFGLVAFTFVAGPFAIASSSSAYARGGADDGAGHDVGDDAGDDGAGHH